MAGLGREWNRANGEADQDRETIITCEAKQA